MNQPRNYKTRKQEETRNITVEGRVPPQNIEFEEAVLGAIMLEKDAFDRVSNILQPGCFYKDSHAKLFKCFQQMSHENKIIDLLSVTKQLHSNGWLEEIGGPYVLTRLTQDVVSTAALEQHAQEVLNLYTRRELIKAGMDQMNAAYDLTVNDNDLLDICEKKLFDITNQVTTNDFRSIRDVNEEALKRIDHLRDRKEDISGVSSGFSSLDRITFGWQPSDLIILAARPAVGKTAFALNLVRNAAMHPAKPTPAAIFSLEMSAAQLVLRVMSAESGIPLEKISRGKMEDYEYDALHAKAIKALDDAKIFIDDTAALNIFEFRAKARRLVNKHKVGFIVIDYLQLMSGTGDRKGNREQEISEISRNLKVLAKELKVPIIALSQLSRAVETRGKEKIPQLSDLRESGAIEQDADMVMFIYRPEYYEQMSNEFGESTRGETHIRIAKHRNGTLDTIKLRALLHIQKFEEWDNPVSSIPGNWKPIGKDYTQPAHRQPDFDDGFTDDQPF